MRGGITKNSGDIRAHIWGGQFVSYPGIDKNAVTDTMSGFSVGQAVNPLYRMCGDNQGIGSGPQGVSILRDGKAWYLY